MKIKFDCVPYYPFRLTSPFIPRDSPNKRTGLPVGATTYHDGVDCGRDRSKYPDAYSNEPAGNVYAVMDGKVIEATYDKGRGHTVLILHSHLEQNVVTLYQHLASECVRMGTIVKAGDVIGQMGRTGMGNDMAIHLHFELRVNRKCIDPLPYIKEVKHNAQTFVPLYLQKTAAKVKKELHFTDESIAFLCTHQLPEELFRKILAGEKLSYETVSFIKKNKNGKFILSRIEEYKSKLKAPV